ncbi:hypothetical protein GCM10009841_17350 [Microlunatus panaciterrae]|uniref:SatD family (SatD) n=1 Tax=Microlunatus panaciterrae TaxID=400768 RepID=A0ABS2RMR5_9ACTN|nr:hypothetical protein [Microlunatus panaciterrae]MBM7800294.1 hypothetical protein [Microlunatus panaciterrae]
MPYVLTVDQRDSRNLPDAVDEAMAALSTLDTLLGFERTIGDEFQGLLDDPLSVVTAMLELMRSNQWHIGLGIGPVDTPLPADTRSGRGPAFVAARTAVDQAKREVTHVSFVGAPPAEEATRDAEVVLQLLATIRERRSEQGWDAVDLMNAGATMAEVAETLKISRQAVGQRLAAANWAVESDALPVLARLLDRAEAISTGRKAATGGAGR